MKSKKGNTALAMAKANSQQKVAEYLSNCGNFNPITALFSFLVLNII